MQFKGLAKNTGWYDRVLQSCVTSTTHHDTQHDTQLQTTSWSFERGLHI